jgi:hypothetical protein
VVDSSLDVSPQKVVQGSKVGGSGWPRHRPVTTNPPPWIHLFEGKNQTSEEISSTHIYAIFNAVFHTYVVQVGSNLEAPMRGGAVLHKPVPGNWPKWHLCLLN